MIRALCEREYLQPSSVLSLDSDRVQRIEHSSGECVSCERGDVTSELYCTFIKYIVVVIHMYVHAYVCMYIRTYVAFLSQVVLTYNGVASR